MRSGKVSTRSSGKLLNDPGAAKWLGVSISTVRRERQRGRLPFYRIGGWRIGYSPEQLQWYLENHCQPVARPNVKTAAA